VRNRITLAAGAAAEWLPQDCILFDGSALDRRLEVDLAADAWFLGVEALVFGRTLMGERTRRGVLGDTLQIRRDGRLLLHDAIRLHGNIDATLAGAASTHGACAVATLVLVAPESMALLDPLREALSGKGAECGASAWDGVLLARIVATRQDRLRATIVAGLAALRGGRPLPRVWLC
jgi:urease accessory protein